MTPQHSLLIRQSDITTSGSYMYTRERDGTTKRKDRDAAGRSSAKDHPEIELANGPRKFGTGGSSLSVQKYG